MILVARAKGRHRLFEIVPEEVSLVDLAANKFRFLIAKRRKPMADSPPTTPAPAPIPVVNTDPPPDSLDAPVGEDSNETEEPVDGTLLTAATAALEQLTEAVETLGELGTGARGQIADLATELRQLADQLAAAAGSDEDDGVPVSVDEDPPDFGVVTETVRATLRQVGSLLDQAKRAKTTRTPSTPAPRAPAAPAPVATPQPAVSVVAPPAAPASQPNTGNQDLSALVNAVNKLAAASRHQHRRLTQVEKSCGLPHSLSVPEAVNKAAPAELQWPLDLNRPLGRENVDKNVSFHQ